MDDVTDGNKEITKESQKDKDVTQNSRKRRRDDDNLEEINNDNKEETSKDTISNCTMNEDTLPPPPSKTNPILPRDSSTNTIATMNKSPSHNRNGIKTKKKLRKLRLEGIFYPKFENENQNDQTIRRDMLSNVSSSRGYLEVTLKHSGSLLLWSGGDRYYSKNSTDNVFTSVGEILLRQHFARAWQDSYGLEAASTSSSSSSSAESKYRECSDYVTKHRLTLSFEVVTSVLGHHGALPHKDFLILTAVADRNLGGGGGGTTFMSTPNLVELAHTFRLPHNDCWVFPNEEGAKKLFELYDTGRETGLADWVVASLTSAVTDCGGGYLRSMYPHCVFQGNILEGIVIRYVPYEEAESNSCELKMGQIFTREEQLKRVADLDLQSQQILQLVPPEKPLFFQNTLDNSPLLKANLRQLFTQSCWDDEQFNDSLRNCLDGVDGNKRRCVKRVHANDDVFPSNEIHVPELVSRLLDELDDDNKNDGNDTLRQSVDIETKRIASLIQKLDGLGASVDYKVFHEKYRPETDSNNKEKTIDDGIEESELERWLCIINVHNDSTFQKYNKLVTGDDMMLYRGFSIELVFNHDTQTVNGDNDDDINNNIEEVNSDLQSINIEKSQQRNKDELMLKMKFLPYMVRTFICRNGLKLLSKSGPDSFDTYTFNTMAKWGISHEAITKWCPFLKAWGIYAYSQMSNADNKFCGGGGGILVDDDGSALSSLPTKENAILPPLTSNSYLHHLDIFGDLYFRGKFNEQLGSDSTFRGLVILVGLNKDEMMLLSRVVADELGRCKVSNDMKKLSEKDMLESLRLKGGGLVCGATVEEGVKTLRNLNKKYETKIMVVIVGCSDEELSAGVIVEKDRRKRMGMTNSFRKYCKQILELPRSALFSDEASDVNESKSIATSCDEWKEKTEFQNLISNLVDYSDSISQTDGKPGMLVFFPAIPGSGKSSICSAITPKSTKTTFQDICNDLKLNVSKSSGTERTVIVRVGDQIKEKFYPLVLRQKLECPSSIYVADKNCPSNSWSTIGNVCSKSRSVAVTVLPSTPALQTTTIPFFGKSANSKIQFRRSYPFSLHYLATCMIRVLDRPPQSHAGKLDGSLKNACMVVIQFYCLYQNITAEKLPELLVKKLDAAGAASSVKPIQVPFFSSSSSKALPELPNDLSDALHDGIRLQSQVESNQVASDSQECTNMENRLRTLLSRYKDELVGITAPEEESKKSFVTQLANHVHSLDSMPIPDLQIQPSSNSSNPSSTHFIKIVCIDVDKEIIDNLLTLLATTNTSVSSFLQGAKALSGDATHTQNGNHPNGKAPTNGSFVKKPHVTLAHYTQLSQLEMRSRFGSFESKSTTTTVTVKEFLFGDRVAAFGVSLHGGGGGCHVHDTDSATKGGMLSLPVPPIMNAFPHITVWCGKGVGAVESNRLEEWVKEGVAMRVVLDRPVLVEGVIRFKRK